MVTSGRAGSSLTRESGVDFELDFLKITAERGREELQEPSIAEQRLAEFRGREPDPCLPLALLDTVGDTERYLRVPHRGDLHPEAGAGASWSARQVHANQRRMDLARADFERSVELLPDFAEAHYNLGLAMHLGGDTQGAIAQYSQAVQLSPDNARAHNNLGVALYRQGRIREAMAHVAEAARLR